MNGNYDGSQIVVLEGLEAVRVRPGMYIGGVEAFTTLYGKSLTMA